MVPPRERRTWAKSQNEAKQTLRAKRPDTLYACIKANSICPLERKEVIDSIAVKVIRESVKVRIPLIVEVLFDPSGARFLKVVHYDFWDDLSDAEVGLVSGLVAAVSKTHRRTARPFRHRLEFVLD